MNHPDLPDHYEDEPLVVDADIKANIESTLAGDESSVEPNKEKRLSPEQMSELLADLEERFNHHPEHYVNLECLPRLLEGVTFEEVQACLENDPILAMKVYAMYQRGGQPDVWSRADKSLLFFESIQEACEASRNCVYDQVQAEWLRNEYPNDVFNGSVEGQCEAMGGVEVMSEQLWREMKKLGSFTIDGWEWLDSRDILATGDAWCANNYDDGSNVFRESASANVPNGGWRAIAKGEG